MSDNKLLVISPTPSHPQTAGNRARVYSLLSNIESLGIEVHFLYVDLETGDSNAMHTYWGNRYYHYAYRKPVNWLSQKTRRLKKRFKLNGGYTYKIDEWYDPALDDYIKNLHSKINFKAVMVEYVFLSRALECFADDVLKIIDTHDVFTNRHKHYLSQGEQPTWFSTSANEEAKALSRSDIVLAIQDKEARYFSTITSSQVVTIGHIIKINESPSHLIDAGRILLMGSNNQINIQAANYFIKEVFPRVQEKISSAHLVIAGSVCNALGENKDVIYLGLVDDLSETYATANVVVNPMLFGTGLKIKSLEAMSYSKPLVTTASGGEGLEEGRDNAFKLVFNSDDFANSIVNILEQPELAQQLSENAALFVEKRNTEVLHELKQLFEI